jgi:hypothetical protein
VLRYAARCVELARETLAFDAEPRFLELLSEAWSNVPDAGNGADIYRRAVGEGR